MDPSLRLFISEFAGAVAGALVPVILVTFLSMPFTMGGHPGETRPATTMSGMHLS